MVAGDADAEVELGRHFDEHVLGGKQRYSAVDDEDRAALDGGQIVDIRGNVG